MNGSQDLSNDESGWPESEQGVEEVEQSSFRPVNASKSGQRYDESMPTALVHPESEEVDLLGSSELQNVELGKRQEMQEKSGGGLLAANQQAFGSDASQPIDLMDDDTPEEGTGGTLRSEFA